MVRAMLSEKQLPKQYWDEAAKWSNYVLNHCRKTDLKDITPEQAWSGFRPSVEHFRVFGCLAYVHVPKEEKNQA